MKKKQMPRDMTQLPVYEITIEEDGNQGIRLVSLVKDPAIEVKGMFFSKEELEKEKNYEFKNIDDKQIIVGPAMIPNKKILRKDDNDNLYYVIFKPETIKSMVDKFNSENNNKSINVDHSNQMVSAFIQQNWIIEDNYYDKSKMYGFNLPLGTWFIEVKVLDKKFWEDEVKQSGKYGFSIEGLMGEEPITMSVHDIIDSLSVEELFDIIDDISEVPMHPNCKCEIDEFTSLWVRRPDSCEHCKEAQEEFNKAIRNGDFDYAKMVFNKHKGL